MNPFYSFLLGFVLCLSVACEGENIGPAAVAEVDDWSSELPWFMPQEEEGSLSQLYIYSEGVIGSVNPPGYRVSGKFWDGRAGAPLSITRLHIGEVATDGDNGGGITAAFGKHLNGDEHRRLIEYTSGGEAEVRLEDASGTLLRFPVRLRPKLAAQIVQDGNRIPILDTIDRAEPLSITWPVATDGGPMPEEDTRRKVEVFILYGAGAQRDNSKIEAVPEHLRSVYKTASFAEGEIVFSPEELSRFLPGAELSFHIHHWEYAIDDDGTLRRYQLPGGEDLVVGYGQFGWIPGMVMR